MKDLDAVGRAAERFLELEKKRTEAIDAARLITRDTKKMIHAIHVGEDYRDIADRLRQNVEETVSGLENEPTVFHSAVLQDSFGEYAEAFIFADVVGGKSVPSFESLGIPPQAWVLGLADSIGEMRRMVLAYLMEGRIADAKELFSKMESISDDVLGFDVPDAIVPLRRKQDIARSVIERTRSDIANAVVLAHFDKN